MRLSPGPGPPLADAPASRRPGAGEPAVGPDALGTAPSTTGQGCPDGPSRGDRREQAALPPEILPFPFPSAHTPGPAEPLIVNSAQILAAERTELGDVTQ